MTILTLIARVSDGLMLAEAMDTDANAKAELDEYRNQAKKIIKSLSSKKIGSGGEESTGGKGEKERVSVDLGGSNGNYYICYITDNDVCYLSLCEKSYPKKLAIKFLEELQKEFDIQYGHDVPSTKRPYAFIKFDTFIQKTKKVYSDTRSQKNLHRVAEDLSDVNKIMTKNISDILERGEKINSVAKKSDAILAYSERYEKAAKNLNMSLLWRQYGPPALILLFILFVFYWRFFW